MNTTFELISPEKVLNTETDWSLCFICQEDAPGQIRKPFNKLGFDIAKLENTSYSTLAKDLFDFKKYKYLSLSLEKRIRDYESFKDLTKKLAVEKAIYHKDCLSKYNQSHLDRLKNKRRSEKPCETEPSSSRRLTRRLDPALNFADICFFCDNRDGSEILHECQTLYLDMRVRKLAQDMMDTKLLNKLSEGDMVAIEAKYHGSCLVKLYNKYRDFNRQKYANEYKDEFAQGMALSEVIYFIEESIRSSEASPVFLLKDLKSMYEKNLLANGVHKYIHSTRFKEHLLESIPGLYDTKKGRDILISLDGEAGRALFEACENSCRDDILILAKAAQIIRRDIFQNEYKFDGDFSQNNQKLSIPHSMQQLMELVLEGYVSKSESTKSIANNIGQLLKFNCVKTKRRKTVAKTRHSKSLETPLPVATGLFLHKTRKRGTVDFFAKKGLSITHTRVDEIEDQIAMQKCAEYRNLGFVYPSGLQEGFFTTAAIDNIDKNFTSVMSSNSFHGTTISIFQHTDANTPFQEQSCKLDFTRNTTSFSLPESYTEIKPTRECHTEALVTSEYTSNIDTSGTKVKHFASQWIEKMAACDGNIDDPISFSSYYSRMQQPLTGVSNIVLLPLFEESINSPAMVRHCAKIVKRITNKANPNQVTVITADQPVYALGKQVQWTYTEESKDVFWMMGGLHIEMAYMNAMGNWLEGSGWVECFERGSNFSLARVESFLHGNKVKRCRYGHQVSLAAFQNLAKDAYDLEKSELVENITFDEWVCEKEKSSVNASYWFQMMSMEIVLFMFVRSHREANFEMFVTCLKCIIPWMFALDHVHYARWLPVYLRDLETLDEFAPGLFKHFLDGHFTVKKTNNNFSNIAIDQAHEQNNKLVKIDGGAVGILDSPRALLKWAVVTPEISSILEKFDIKMITSLHEELEDAQLHHEDTKPFEEMFRKDVNQLYEELKSRGNPFLANGDELENIDNRCIMTIPCSESVRNAFTIGKQAYEKFCEDRLILGTTSIYSTISQNKLPLFRQKNTLVTPKSKLKLLSLKADCQLYSSLYVASQARQADLDEFFAHENHAYPVSLSEYGKLRKTDKSDFLKCLREIEEPSYDAPSDMEMIVIDGAALVHINSPKKSKTFGEYCEAEIGEKIKNIALTASRVDVVFDVYRKNSLKAETRESRGNAVRVSVKDVTPVYNDFKKFLRHNENKTELFSLIADKIPIVAKSITSTVICTKKSDITSNCPIDLSTLAPCNHEEADSRMFVHLNHGAEYGKKCAMIKTVDTDVVVIAIGNYFQLHLDELWVEFGTGTNKRWYAIHKYAHHLGMQKSLALLFWFAFTGCDTVSSFNGRGKKTAWNVWEAFPDVTESFVRLSLGNAEISQNDIDLIERFVVLLYDRVGSTSSVNHARHWLFTKKGRPIDNCPPTADALLQHIRRAILQSSIWREARHAQQAELDPSKFGWSIKSEETSPLWMTNPEASKSCQELVKCGCKKTCSGRCKCKKSGFVCTELCYCSGGCTNIN